MFRLVITIVIFALFLLVTACHPGLDSNSRECCINVASDRIYEKPLSEHQSDNQVRVYIRDDQQSVGAALYSPSTDRSKYFLTRDTGDTWEHDSDNQVFGDSKYLSSLMTAKSESYSNPYDSRIRYKTVKLAGGRAVLERSIDSGKTWRTLKLNIDGCKPIITSTAPRYFHPQDPNTVYFVIQVPWLYAASHIGMFVSHDGGDTLSMLFETEGWCPLAISKRDPKIMFAAGLRGSVIKTDNGGKTWKLIGQNDDVRKDYVLRNVKGTAQEKVILGEGYTKIREIQIDIKNPQIVYIATSKGVIKSTDGGERWCIMNLGVNDADSIYDIVIDPHNNNVLYVGGVFGLLRSRDQGCQWNPIVLPSDLVK